MEVRDIGFDSRVREALCQHLSAVLVLVGEHHGVEPGLLKTELEASDSCVQTDQRHVSVIAVGDATAKVDAHDRPGETRFMLDANEGCAADRPAGSIDPEIVELHERCGVYTRVETVDRLLDLVGWTAEADLSRARLLEPAAGDAAFLTAAARRLVASFRRERRKLTAAALKPRLLGLELHPEAAQRGRVALRAVLGEAGLSPAATRAIAAAWLVTEDFLLSDMPDGAFTHVVGNPPYARWSKIPVALRKAYENRLPAYIAKGDLFLPFLDRGIAVLSPEGRLGFVCSNRWKYMAFAEEFRRRRLPDVRVLMDEDAAAEDVFRRAVDVYPSILGLERLVEPLRSPVVRQAGKTLVERGFRIRVGPALGCTDAYVLQKDDAEEVEDELLAPWVDGSGVREGTIDTRGRRVICMHDEAGRLRDLDAFPMARARLERRRDRLSLRSIVRTQAAEWYRPIDRVIAGVWAPPKLLIPELAKSPRVALDESGAVPSHGVYAIFATTQDADIYALNVYLSNGKLSELLSGIAPRIKGGHIRCYKGILNNVRIYG